MTKQWRLLERFDYDRETTLGSSLRAWMSVNNVSEHEAATHLQNHGVRGAVQNIDRWLKGEPAGELYTLWRKRFEELTGINHDRLMVVEAKRQAIKVEPSIDPLIQFDSLQTRRELVDTAVNHADRCYGGNYRCVAHQLGVGDQAVSHWKRGHYLPSDDELVKLAAGLGRGLIPASCVEDCLLAIACQGMFGHTTAELFPGVSGFKDLLTAQFARLKGSTSKEDKVRVFDLKRATVDRLRHWEPNANNLPMDSVLGVMRVAIKYDHTELLARFDDLRETFAHTWRAEETRAVISPHPSRPAANVVQKPAPVPATPPAPEHTTASVATDDGRREVVDMRLDELARALRGFAPSLRAMADVLDPNGRGDPAVSSFTHVIGETMGELEHCLGASGFPNLSGVQTTEDDQQTIQRMFAIFRRFALALGGLDPAVRSGLNLKVGLEETVLILYGLLKYEEPGAALRILNANLEMARHERARRRR